MPDDYSYKSSGTNSQVNNQTCPRKELSISFTELTDTQPLHQQGNHYCSRDYGSDAANSNSYHYSNSDGSYYYSNSNGSTYYNSGNGYSSYTAPSGGNGGSSGGKK
ncbi:hypothetical protein F66182_16811 [Fusarium sp. NRRL 66182]|nr:hypothetical protein F66182_16811 [Fusarium sp. NRRL 66182]